MIMPESSGDWVQPLSLCFCGVSPVLLFPPGSCNELVTCPGCHPASHPVTAGKDSITLTLTENGWLDDWMDGFCLNKGWPFQSQGRPWPACAWVWKLVCVPFFSFRAHVSKVSRAFSRAFVCTCSEHVQYNLTLAAHYFNKPRLVSRWQIICPGKQILWPLISQPPPSRRSLLCGI